MPSYKGWSVTKSKKLPDSDKLIKNFILNGLTNAKQAAIDAGYSPRSAEQSASRVLRSDKAKRLIAKYKATQLNDYVWTKTDKLKKLEAIIDKAMSPDNEKGMINMPSAITALKEHNLMQGDNMPTVIDQTITTNIMPVPTADSIESWEFAAQDQQKEILGKKDEI